MGLKKIKRSWVRGAAWIALGLFAFGLRADPIISEFMAANTSTLADGDGAFSDWIEVHNPDLGAVDLTGWYLTDAAANKTKWRFPAVSLPAGGYLVVFASNKDRTDPGAPLHTNFALGAGGEYLALVKPDGATVASEFAPAYPAQSDDISYGRVSVAGGWREGFLRKPTPGEGNGGPDALQLAETVEFSRAAGLFSAPFTLTLSGAAPDQRIRYIVASGPGAVDVELTAESPSYEGPIAIAGTSLVRAAVFASDGAMRGRVRSVHYVRQGAGLADFRSRLPVIVLDVLGAGPLAKDGADHASWLFGYAAAASGGATWSDGPALTTPLLATVRGSSSAEFPKKGYNLKLRDERGGKRAAALFNLPAFEKWALVAPWSFDMNFINNAFVYELSNRLGRWAPRTRMVEVFFNPDGDDLDPSDYAGIYVITDRIEVKKGRVEGPTLSANDATEPAISGTYVLKIDEQDPDEIGWVTDRGVPQDEFMRVVLVEPDAEDVTPAQLDYIQGYVQRMENALHADRATGWAQRTYLDYLDRAAWVDHHLLNVLVSNPDAFERSAYFTKRRGGKLAAGPVWDFDRALGGPGDERSLRTGWSDTYGADVWRSGWWGVIAQDPEFRQDWIERWQGLRATELSNERLTGLAQSLADTVGGAAAARDVARWPDNASPHGDYAAQIAYLKTWLIDRARWIDQQFVAAPTIAADGGNVVFTPPPGAVLAYTLDGSDPRSLGGSVAPNALLSSGPLSVPFAANVHVRSYNEALKDAFPGSPWSSAVGGEQSSPLAPVARLVNLSTRAMVGSGADSLIVGFVVADSEAKRFLARGIGPGLAAFGAGNVVADPQLSFFTADGVERARNNGWETALDAAQLPALAKSVGAFPLAEGSADAALSQPAAAGNHTVQLSTPSGSPGVGLAELYELDANGRTVNLSTRARVGTGDGVVIGGFVLSGPAYQRILVRAIGPTLAAFGVPGNLADPVLTIYSGSTVIASNDRWESGERAEWVATTSQRVGAFSLAAGSEDAALFLTLPPGAYTVEVKGKDGGEGIALLEIYAVP